MAVSTRLPERPPFWDRVVATISPERAVARAKARSQLRRIGEARNLYEAAAASRRTSGWRSVAGSDANSETKLANARLRDVARDMVRNNAFAARAKEVLGNDTVGEGIIPQTKARTDGRKAQIESLIRRHFETTDVDADGLMNLYGLQQLVMKTIVESGECLIRKRIRRPTDGYVLPFQIQILEPDYLDTFVDGPLKSGNIAVQGIEFDLRGKRVAYYLFDQHPGAITTGQWVSTRGVRVSADFVQHIYRVDRPGQVRGVTWFAPVVVRLRDFADFTDAQLLRQKIAACFAAFVTTDEEAVDPTGNGVSFSPSGIPAEQFEPGMIERLRTGETVTFATPPTTQDFGSYSSVTLHEIATGLGTTYEALTGDLAGVNYSSGRMGWLQYQRNIDCWRWNMIIPQMLHRLEDWTVEAAQVATGSSEPFSFSWTPPRRQMIDPTVEIEASKSAIRSGLSWLSEEQRKLGFDPAEVRQGIIDDNKWMNENDVILDVNPAQVSGRGVTQKNAVPGSDNFAP